MPTMKLSQKQIIFAHNVTLFLMWIYHQGWEVTFGEVARPKITQLIYIWAKRSKTIISKHLNRLAIDLNLFIDGVYVEDPELYRPLGEYWESLGGRWGGRFGVKPKNYDKEVGWDARHFEFK